MVLTDKKKFLANAQYGTPLEPVSREKGQCDWCKFRVTGVCGAEHKIKDHCMGMGHRCLPCDDYQWYMTPEKDIRAFLKLRGLAILNNKFKVCKCQEHGFYAKLYMKIFRRYKDHQLRKFMSDDTNMGDFTINGDPFGLMGTQNRIEEENRIKKNGDVKL